MLNPIKGERGFDKGRYHRSLGRERKRREKGRGRGRGVEDMGNGEEVRDDGFLPGFRFHPTDEELVGFYLRRKVERKALCVEIIKQVDIYKYDPWDLPTSGHDSKEWYFFCMRGRKYRNSVRPNRVTGSGFWKATGIDRPIYKPGGAATAADCIGLKKSLVYYLGSAGKGQKTDWMMHEFRLPSSSAAGDTQEAELWTICRIFKRNVSCKRYPQPQRWESPAPAAGDSSSKTSSGESEGLWEASAEPAFMEGELSQWTSALQTSPFIPQEEVVDHGSDLFFKDEFDEIRRMMDLPIDPSSLVYDCIY